jgi:hypothetical protein
MTITNAPLSYGQTAGFAEAWPATIFICFCRSDTLSWQNPVSAKKNAVMRKVGNHGALA